MDFKGIWGCPLYPRGRPCHVCVLHVIYSEKRSQNVDPRESCKLSVFVLAPAFFFPPLSPHIFSPFSVFFLSSFIFSLYYSIFSKLCFIGPGIQPWYSRQRGDTQCKFFQKYAESSSNESYLCALCGVILPWSTENKGEWQQLGFSGSYRWPWRPGVWSEEQGWIWTWFIFSSKILKEITRCRYFINISVSAQLSEYWIRKDPWSIRSLMQ